MTERTDILEEIKMGETLLERLAKAPNADAADKIISEASAEADALSDRLDAMRTKYQDGGDVKAHREFQKTLLKATEFNVFRAATDDPQASLFWHLGNVELDSKRYSEGVSDYARILSLESAVFELSQAVFALFAVVRQPEVARAIQHLIDADEAAV